MKVNFPTVLNTPKIQLFPKQEQRLLTMQTQLPVFVMQPVVDIHSKSPYPGNVLSNFRRCSFMLDGIKCASIEGVIQSLKVIIPSPKENLSLWKERMDLQKKVCSYANNRAKRQGNFLNFFNKERKLSWRGQPIDRWSDEYQNFLKRIFDARYNADAEYRKALYDTRNCRLTHSIGKHDKAKTNLTEEEFIGLLLYLRKKYNIV